MVDYLIYGKSGSAALFFTRNKMNFVKNTYKMGLIVKEGRIIDRQQKSTLVDAQRQSVGDDDPGTVRRKGVAGFGKSF